MQLHIPLSFFLLLAASTPSFGQVTGGWIKYEFNGVDARAQTFSYYVTLYLYADRNPPRDQEIAIRCWDAATGKSVTNTSQDPPEYINFRTVSNIFSLCSATSALNNNYLIGTKYFSLSVPINDDGYYLTVNLGGKGMSPNLVNIYDPQNTGILLIARIYGTGNGQPYFNIPTPNIDFTDTVSVCRNNYFSFPVKANVSNGDSLSYSFGDALTQNNNFSNLPPETPVAYFGTYTGKEPMGPGVTIDPVTGIISGTAPDVPGGYLLAVYVQEWRKGVLINTTCKESQVKVVSCPYTHPILQPLYSSCRVQTFTFAAGPTCPNITNYRWDFGDTTTLADTSTLATPTYTYSGKGPYTLSLQITNNNGFIDSATSVVRVFDSVKVDLRPDTAICSTDTIQLRPTSDATSFAWRENGSGKTLSGYNLKSPRAFPFTGTTTYYVSGRLNSCADSASITVHASPYPRSNAGVDTAICAGAKVFLQGAVSGAYFTWNPIGSLTNANSLRPLAYPQKTTIYTLSVRDTFYCPKTVTDSVLVKVVPNFKVDAGRDASVVVGQPYQLNAVTTGNTEIVKYLWQPSAYLNDSTVSDPIAKINSTFPDIIPFTVKATTVVGGCTATDVVELKIFGTGPDILVPTGFTPNGDGKNDVLRPILVGMRKLDFFTVYDRFGSTVFTTSEEGKGWDGTYIGNLKEGGSYVFVAQGVDYLGKVVLKKGTVVLIR